MPLEIKAIPSIWNILLGPSLPCSRPGIDCDDGVVWGVSSSGTETWEGRGRVEEGLAQCELTECRPVSFTDPKGPFGLGQPQGRSGAMCLCLSFSGQGGGPWEQEPGSPEEALQAGHPVSFFEDCFCF